jgi:hypothetical protein
MLPIPTISSLEIAALLETRHDHTRQSIERLVSEGYLTGVTLSTSVEPNSRGADRITRVYNVPTEHAVLIPKRKHSAASRIAFFQRVREINYEASQTPEALEYAEAMRRVHELISKQNAPAQTIDDDEAPQPRTRRQLVDYGDDE